MRFFILSAALFLFFSCSNSPRSSDPGKPPKDVPIVYRHKSYADTSAESVYFNLIFKSRTQSLSWSEQYDLGVAKVLMNDYAGAQSAFEAAASAVDHEKAKIESKQLARALSYSSAAQCAALCDRYAYAGKLANIASECAPNNKEIAALRLGLWCGANDQLEIRVAREHVQRLNVNLDPNVKEAGLFGGCVMIFATGSYLGYQWYKTGAPPHPAIVYTCLGLVCAGFLECPL